jgi:hypothetical protein
MLRKKCEWCGVEDSELCPVTYGLDSASEELAEDETKHWIYETCREISAADI